MQISGYYFKSSTHSLDINPDSVLNLITCPSETLNLTSRFNVVKWPPLNSLVTTTLFNASRITAYNKEVLKMTPYELKHRNSFPENGWVLHFQPRSRWLTFDPTWFPFHRCVKVDEAWNWLLTYI